MLRLVLIVGVIFFAVKVLWSVVAVGTALRYLRRGVSFAESASGDESGRIFIVIPLLREQARLSELIARFGSFLGVCKCLRLVLVTTQREEMEAADSQVVATRQLITSSVAFDLLPADRRFHFRYPDESHTVSQQMSYAIGQLLDSGAAKPQDYVLFYNADSTVDLGAIEIFVKYAQRRVSVVQQSALFLQNYNTLLRTSSYLAAGDALFQSGWTLAREIPRYLIGSGLVKWVPSVISGRWFAHCVGHGLLVRIETLLELGGLPPLLYGLEDGFVGYQLRAMGVAIVPMTVLERADAAPDVRTLLRQKSQWVRGPLGTIEYFLIAWRRGVPQGETSVCLSKECIAA